MAAIFATAVAAATAQADDAFAQDISELCRPVIIGTMAGMWAFGDDEDVDSARYILDAQICANGLAEIIKRVTGQPRPSDPTADDGFPSGHTSAAFAFARSMSEYAPEAAPFAWGFAAATAWARVETDRHSWAQSLAGAVLGTWIAGESIKHDGGLLGGVIAPDRSALVGTTEAPAMPGYTVTVWAASW